MFTIIMMHVHCALCTPPPMMMMLVTVIRDCGQSFVSGAGSLITSTVDWSAVHRGRDDDDVYRHTTLDCSTVYFSIYSTLTLQSILHCILPSAPMHITLPIFNCQLSQE